ncbi:MAG: potassium channel family protein [Bdellovibrionia bacterium]
MGRQKIAIIGLGQFGMPLAQRLTEQGAEVLGIDTNAERVELLRDKIAHAVILDTTDIRALRQLELHDFDAVVVAIGDNFEASLLTTAHLQELKVKRIISRVLSPVHERLLKLMKVTELIIPEGEAASHMARRLSLKGVIEHLDISDEYSLVEAEMPKWACGKTIQEIDLRRKYKLNLITVLRKKNEEESLAQGKKAAKTVLGIPDGNLKFSAEDILVLFGHNDDIREFLASV